MIQVHPIALTQVNWVDYLNLAKKTFNFSITKNLDKAGIKLDNIAAFIVSIAEMQYEVSNPIYTLRESGGILKHVSITFFVIAHTDIILELIQESNLYITTASLDSGFKAAILSANLEQWKISIINCCSETVSINLRKLFDKILIHMEQMGLNPLWDKYRKVNLNDTTFKILEKKVMEELINILIVYIKKINETENILREWISKQGHNRCHYYPELFKQLIQLYNINDPNWPKIPLEEFKAGCQQYWKEEYPNPLNEERSFK